MVNELDPIGWYSNRELLHTPTHFVVATTELTNESKMWIMNNLKGRFSVVRGQDGTKMIGSIPFLDLSDGYPAFEDPREATLYELKWS